MQQQTDRDVAESCYTFVEARRSDSAADDRHQTYANPLWKYKLFMIGYTHG